MIGDEFCSTAVRGPHQTILSFKAAIAAKASLRDRKLMKALLNRSPEELGLGVHSAGRNLIIWARTSTLLIFSGTGFITTVKDAIVSGVFLGSHDVQRMFTATKLAYLGRSHITVRMLALFYRLMP